ARIPPRGENQAARSSRARHLRQPAIPSPDRPRQESKSADGSGALPVGPGGPGGGGSGTSSTPTWALMLPALLAVGGPGGAKLPSVTLYTCPPNVAVCDTSDGSKTVVMLALVADRVPLKAPLKVK